MATIGSCSSGASVTLVPVLKNWILRNFLVKKWIAELNYIVKKSSPLLVFFTNKLNTDHTLTCLLVFCRR